MTMSLHGTMVVIDKVGALLIGKPATGKSSLAMHLIDRGHQLVGDDIIDLEIKNNDIMASCHSINRGFLYTRELGLLDITQLYSGNAICQSHSLDIVIELISITENQKKETQLMKEFQNKVIDNISVPLFTLSSFNIHSCALYAELLVKNYQLGLQGKNSLQTFIQKQQSQQRITTHVK